ncbi:MAG: 16S rRNA (uracil(1498)-N(3))-methyltransferase [Gammaproteobacteria bacterium]|nr:16S rRNA (uracil(1498)-N(3))-methyltransferase [Gammaproteobacteria bacterium]MCP5138183.1 16S rRNA (uracil(1498)-N(3))-methyltransferase [Gammaproteobacteria bacterium]
MRNPRIHVDQRLGVGDEFALPEGPARHVAQVLRMRVGDALTLFNGDGNDYGGELLDVTRRDARVRIDTCNVVEKESSLRITLLQGISKGERMDWVMQKSVELGVHAIVPVVTERTVVRIDDSRSDKKLAHWQGVVISACEQSGRAVIPEVREPIRFAEAIAQFKGAVLDPLASISLTAGRPEAAQSPLAASLLIGPEGGLSDVEIDQAKQAGWVGARLGPRVLRTETAALAALAVMQASWGDLAN